MEFRGELEALNALIREQRRTNDLLEQYFGPRAETPVLRSLDVVSGDTVISKQRRTVKPTQKKRPYQRKVNP